MSLLSLSLSVLLWAEPPQPVQVTIVASPSAADTVAASLDPRLGEIGLLPAFDRCDDFGCARAPRPSDGMHVFVVVEGTHALAIVTWGSPAEVWVQELVVGDPLTPVDLEALGHATTRGLVSPPVGLSTDWSAAADMGRWLAPPPVPVQTPALPEPEPEPPPSDAPPRRGFGRGPFVELGAGSATAPGGVLSMGVVSRVGAGFMFEGPRDSSFRATLGLRGSNLSSFGADASGVFAGEARLGLGFATAHLFPSVRLGVGPALTYGNYYGEPSFTGVATAGLGLDGKVGERLSIGIEVGTSFDVVDIASFIYGTLGATWSWDMPSRRRAAR